MKISKRKDRNLYYANVKKPDGGYVKVYGKTKREVREKYDEVVEKILNGKYVEKNSMTIKEWSEIWTKNYFLNLKNSTIEAYTSHLRNHIVPCFGKMKIQALKRMNVQKFINDLNSKGLSPKSIKNIHLTLHRLLKDAVLAEIIPSNPAENILLPKMVKQEMVVLNEDNIKLFLDTAEDMYPDYYDVFKFFLLSGLRVGELIGLTFDRYNSETHSILIDRQLNKAMHFNFDTPKHDVTRIVYIPPEAEKIILERQKVFEDMNKRLGKHNKNKDGFIFFTDEGNHLTHTILYKRFKKIVNKIKIPNLRIHDLRHTFATIALKSGMDIKTLQKILGHSDATFTLNRYGHSTDTMSQEAASNFGSMFRKILNN